MFKKKPTPPSGRHRQPPLSSERRTSVFSYHASRSDRPQSGSGRNADLRTWAEPANRPSKNLGNAGHAKRLITVCLVVLVAIVVGNSLLVGKNPQVIALSDSKKQQLFLRNQAIYKRAAQDVLAGSLANTNKLTIDTTGVSAALEKRFPELEQVTVVLPMLERDPIVYIQPAKPALLLKTTDGGLFVLDNMGRALLRASQARDLEKLALLVVEDQSGLTATIGRVALPSAEVAFITEVVGQLQAKNLTIVGMVIPRGTSELDVRLEGKPYTIKFNLRGDARLGAGAYLAVHQHLERENKTPATYIDVRVNNRVYYQ
jgi:hypothetical protein